MESLARRNKPECYAFATLAQSIYLLEFSSGLANQERELASTRRTRALFGNLNFIQVILARGRTVNDWKIPIR